jgi:hypothetical protein
MPSQFKINIRVKSRLTTRSTTKRRGPVLLAGTLLLAGGAFLLWQNIGFGIYALTGFFWIRTDGTITNPRTTSTPSIRFTAHDGAPILFKEDYILLCGGHRSLCLVRDFNPGQVVSVVYDPVQPNRAYVYDWALFAGVITWFLVAGAGLLLALMMSLPFIKAPVNLLLPLGRSSDPQ